MKLIKPSVAALAAISVLALGACGSDDSKTSSGGWTPGADPTTATDATGTETPEETEPGETEETGEGESGEGEAPAASAGEEVSAELLKELMLTAYEAVETARIRTVTTTAGAEMTMEGVVDYTSSPLKATMTMKGGPGESIEIRMVDGKMYMSMGEVTGGKFFEIDPTDEDSPFNDMGDFEAMGDPAKAFEQYADGFTGGVYVGEEDVNGVTADHYEVTVDLSKVPSMKDLATEAGGEFEPMTMHMWFDDEGRPVVTESAMTFMGTETSSRTEMSDFGVEVDVKAPAPSQITKMPGA